MFDDLIEPDNSPTARPSSEQLPDSAPILAALAPSPPQTPATSCNNKCFVRSACGVEKKFIVVYYPIPENFLNAAKKTYNIPHDEAITVTDEHGTEIPIEFFQEFYWQNHHQCFIIRKESEKGLTDLSTCGNLSTLPSLGSVSAFETSSNLENISTNPVGRQFLRFAEFIDDCKYTLIDGETEVQRVDLVRKAVEYLVMRFGYHPSVLHRITVAKEIIELYPQFKNRIPGSEGYEHFADPKNHAAGFITNRFKTINARLNKGQRPRRKKSAELSLDLASLNDEEFLKLVTVLKEATLPRDLSRVTEIALQLAPRIHQYLEVNGTKISISETFPRFYDTKGLIRLCFGKSFKAARDSFKDWWDQYKTAVAAVIRASTKKSYDACFEDWPEDIRTFLNLAFLMPSREKGETTGKNEKYEDRVVSSLLRFKKSGVPMKEFLQQVKTIEPFIVAEGISKSESTKFIIILDRNPVSPAEASFLDAFDVVFKCYFLFNIKYNPACKHFLNFIDNYVFKISRKISQTSTMREVYSKILEKKEEQIEEANDAETYAN